MPYLCSVDERDDSTKLNLKTHNTIIMTAMKLGTETNSLVNSIYSQCNNTPVAGEGATLLRWSDREPLKVLEVSKNGKQCKVARIDAKLIEGSCADEHQVYDYSNVTSDTMDLVYRYNNWYEVYISPYTSKKEYNKLNIMFGKCEKYVDPTF